MNNTVVFWIITFFLAFIFWFTRSPFRGALLVFGLGEIGIFLLKATDVIIDVKLDLQVLFIATIVVSNFFIWKRGLYIKRKKQLRTDRSTSSEIERIYKYNKLKAYPGLAPVFAEGIVHIYHLISTLDSAINREKIEEYIKGREAKSLKKMQGKFPYDFDEKDYPVLDLYLIKTILQTYLVIIRQDCVKYEFTGVKIIPSNFYDKDNFETRRLVYPI